MFLYPQYYQLSKLAEKESATQNEVVVCKQEVTRLQAELEAAKKATQDARNLASQGDQTKEERRIRHEAISDQIKQLQEEVKERDRQLLGQETKSNVLQEVILFYFCSPELS